MWFKRAAVAHVGRRWAADVALRHVPPVRVVHVQRRRDMHGLQDALPRVPAGGPGRAAARAVATAPVVL